MCGLCACFFVLVLFRIVARDLLSLQVLVLMLRACFVLSLFFCGDRIVFLVVVEFELRIVIEL